MIFKALTCAAALLVVSTGSAEAAVTYTFTGTNAGVDGATDTFTYTAPAFITTDRLVDAPDLDSCTVAMPVGATCGIVRFLQNSPIDNSTNDVIEFQPFGMIASRYAFADGAFASFGTYTSITAGVNTVGTLIVANATAAVPEPATWAMMIAGVGIVGAALRGRRRCASTATAYA